MSHLSNIRAFIAAAAGPDHLIQAYCGLVAIELALKAEVGLSDHNVIVGLNRFRTEKAVADKSWTGFALISFATQLQSSLVAIQVNDRLGQPRSAPHDSYPYIRYSRFAVDGWPEPHTGAEKLQGLAMKVQEVRAFLRKHFGLPL